MIYIVANRAAESLESTDYPGFHGILDRLLTGDFLLGLPLPQQISSPLVRSVTTDGGFTGVSDLS